MQERIKSINIHAFRGICDLPLELDGKNLVLRGENGTGKSSIVEAIEFFFTGKVALFERTQGLSLRRHVPHIDFNPEEVNIEVTFNPGTVNLNRTFISSPIPPTNLEEYFQIAQNSIFILRRSQLLEFILSKPAERFRTIGNIIGIDYLDNIELEMKRLYDKLNADVQFKKEEINEIIKDLSKIFNKQISNVEDVLLFLNEILKQNNLPLLGSLNEVDKHAEEMLKVVKKADSINKINCLSEILNELKTPFIHNELIGKIETFSEKINQLMKKRSRLELSLSQLLKTGNIVISEEELDVCPLCEQKIDRDATLNRINVRLKTLLGLSTKVSEVRIESALIKNELNLLLNRINKIISKIDLLIKLNPEKQKITKILGYLEDFINKIENAKELNEVISVQEFLKQKDKIEVILKILQTKSRKMFDEMGLTDDEKKLLEVVRLIERARNKNRDLAKAISILNQINRYYRIAEIIYLKFSEVKKEKIQEIYNSIEGDVERYYRTLHKNDPHKNIGLRISSAKRTRSAELKIESFGQASEDPRAFCSEGHLDSMGLCIFLAFVNKFNDKCSLLILDDVVSTIDAKHRDHICKLLLKEFKEKQLIITTHDALWFEQLRSSQRAYSVEGNFKNMSLIDWNVDMGPKIRPYKPRMEQIQYKISNGDKKGAGNEGRQYLEWLLERIGINIDSQAPIRLTGKYEIRDLFNPVRNRIEKLIKDPTIKSNFLYDFQEIERTGIMGNILSHNNPLAESVSIEEVKRFCNCVNKLHERFLCPTCKHFIIYNRDFGIIRCSNSKCINPIEIKTK